MRLTSRILACGLSAVVMLGSVPAYANSSEKEAFELYQATREDFDKRDFASAVDKLTRAYKMFPKPLILLKRAEAYEAMGLIEESHADYVEVSKASDDMKKRVTPALRRLEGLLAKPVSVSVLSGSVTGARIIVDGKDAGSTTPSVLELPRGAHSIRVVKEGYKPFEISGFVAKGTETLVVEAGLEPLVGRVRVRLDSGTFANTRVMIDDRPLSVSDPASATADPVEVQIGKHDLVCTRPDTPRFYKPFQVEADADVEVSCDFKTFLRAEEPSSAAGWVTLTSGIVAAGVGGGFLYKYYVYDEQRMQDEKLRRVSGSEHIVGAALVGVGVVTMGISYFLFPEAPPEGTGSVNVSGWRLDVAPLDGGGLLGASGRF